MSGADRRSTVRALARAGVLVAALVLSACADGGSSPDRGAEPRTARRPAPRPTTTTTTEPASADLLAAACDDALVVTPGPPVAEPALTEVSGVAVVAGADGAGPTTWVVNDSGDAPRLYGIGPDGGVRAVAVEGAAAIDWEDLAFTGGDRPELWIADTGDNLAAREVVQLYRVPLPAPGVDRVRAATVEVVYTDGPHDVEAVLVGPGGRAHLLTKEPGRSRIYAVELPEAGGPVIAELVGEFRAGDNDTSLVTSGSLAADGSAIVLRTYGRAWLYPVGPDDDVVGALANETARCAGPAGAELQGEAVGFLPDGSGYVTMGEGTNPVLSTVRPPA